MKTKTELPYSYTPAQTKTYEILENFTYTFSKCKMDITGDRIRFIALSDYDPFRGHYDWPTLTELKNALDLYENIKRGHKP